MLHFAETETFRNIYSKFPTSLLLRLLSYVTFHNENLLYSTVAHVHEQNTFTLRCATHVSYTADCTRLYSYDHGDSLLPYAPR